MTGANKEILPLAVSPADGARMLGIGRTLFYHLINTEKIPSFTLGRRRLIKVEDLQAWLDKMSER